SLLEQGFALLHVRSPSVCRPLIAIGVFATDMQRHFGYCPAGVRLQSIGPPIHGDQTYTVTIMTSLTGDHPLWMSAPTHGINDASCFLAFVSAVLAQGVFTCWCIV